MSQIITRGYGGLGAPTAFITTGAVGAANEVTVSFSAQPLLLDAGLFPSLYKVTAIGGAKPVTVTAVATGTNTLVLTTTSQTGSGNYILSLPHSGIVSASYDILGGPFELYFTGTTTPITVLMTRSLDARTMEIIFSTAPVESQALNKANYSINNGLTIAHVKKYTDLTYRLTTSRQTEGTTYTVTVSGIEAA